MFKKIILLTMFGILSYGFWLSPEFKEISAGVAIFLFGMLFLEQGFKAFTGGILERILDRTTDKVWKSLSFGVVSTTLMQSSSLVSVITISFISAGLVTLESGIGIIFGANLGTTTGAWLIAGLGFKVKISAYAMPMLVFGIILAFQSKKEWKGVGYVLAGLGFLFLGIHHMKEGFETFGQNIDLTEYAVSGFKGLLLFTLIGVFATVVMQSSHATLVLIIAALASQQITYENGLALAVGSNIGTTITAIIGSISANINGKRLAGAHLVFNFTTGLIAIVFMNQLVPLVDVIADLLHIAPDNYTLKLAVFHSLFNLIGIGVMLPFINHLTSWLYEILPGQEAHAKTPEYINEAVLALPDTALEAVRKETFNLFQHVIDILCQALNVPETDLKSDKPIREIVSANKSAESIDIEQQYLEDVKGLYAEIVSFISRAGENSSPSQSEQYFLYRAAGQNMVEAIKDAKHLYKNLSRRIDDRNPHIQSEYNKIRQHLLFIIRYIYETYERLEIDDTALLSLDIIEIQIQKANEKSNTELNHLIRDNSVSGIEATSIMKDKNYANQIASKLMEIAEALFTPNDPSLAEANISLQLTEEEIREALDY